MGEKFFNVLLYRDIHQKIGKNFQTYPTPMPTATGGRGCKGGYGGRGTGGRGYN